MAGLPPARVGAHRADPEPDEMPERSRTIAATATPPRIVVTAAAEPARKTAKAAPHPDPDAETPKPARSRAAKPSATGSTPVKSTSANAAPAKSGPVKSAHSTSAAQAAARGTAAGKGTGKTAAGRTDTTESAAGRTAATGTAAGKTAAGKTAAGGSAAGRTATGRAAVRKSTAAPAEPAATPVKTIRRAAGRAGEEAEVRDEDRTRRSAGKAAQEPDSVATKPVARGRAKTASTHAEAKTASTREEAHTASTRAEGRAETTRAQAKAAPETSKPSARSAAARAALSAPVKDVPENRATPARVRSVEAALEARTSASTKSRRTKEPATAVSTTARATATKRPADPHPTEPAAPTEAAAKRAPTAKRASTAKRSPAQHPTGQHPTGQHPTEPEPVADEPVRPRRVRATAAAADQTPEPAPEPTGMTRGIVELAAERLAASRPATTEPRPDAEPPRSRTGPAARSSRTGISRAADTTEPGTDLEAARPGSSLARRATTRAAGTAWPQPGQWPAAGELHQEDRYAEPAHRPPAGLPASLRLPAELPSGLWSPAGLPQPEAAETAYAGRSGLAGPATSPSADPWGAPTEEPAAATGPAEAPQATGSAAVAGATRPAEATGATGLAEAATAATDRTTTTEITVAESLAAERAAVEGMAAETTAERIYVPPPARHEPPPLSEGTTPEQRLAPHAGQSTGHDLGFLPDVLARGESDADDLPPSERSSTVARHAAPEPEVRRTIRRRRRVVLLAYLLVVAGVLVAGHELREQDREAARSVAEPAGPGEGAAQVPAATQGVAPENPGGLAHIPREPVSEPAAGAGEFRYETSRGPMLGTAGQLRRFRVAVEKTVDGTDPAEFADVIDRTLGDERSWVNDGRLRMRRVASGAKADFTIYLASAGTSERMCAAGGLRTEGFTSCRVPGKVIMNVDRWADAVPDYAGRIDEYRRYMINHEVGHELGHGHEACPGQGEKAPVMMQQTYGLKGCTRNAWPYLDGKRYAGDPTL